ncbi:N-acetyltransferase domain-containing protein [Sphingomonas antarctica]|uniref:GNAT family N-acetyltransferase n=1 Tax=Sphingomonas antarctica TaxID=2040274 RepID=UPI0039E8D5C4
MQVREGGLGDPQVEALLHYHRTEAHASTPTDNAHAMDSAALSAPGIRFFSVWDDDELLGVAALRHLDDTHAELKSMRTHPDHLRQGVARTILGYLAAEAQSSGFRRLSLETGTAPMFDPANAMYELYGFVDCDPFGGYPPSEHNRFMTLEL